MAMRYRASLSIILVSAAALGLLGWAVRGGGEESAPPAPARPGGVAVVINADAAPEAALPGLGEFHADGPRVSQTFRNAGLRVEVDPTGRCLAVTAPVHVSDEAVEHGDLAYAALAAAIVERLTPAQYAARKKGYLPAGALSPVQLAAARGVAERLRLIDKQGRPREEGASLHIGVWPTWLVHVSTFQGGKPVCQKLDIPIRPPTAVAIPKAPLPGSVLWWAWPEREASRGDEGVNIPPGTYTLGDLADRLSESGEMKITADPQAREKRFAVVASEVPLRKLVWATAVAGSLQVRLSGDSKAPAILLTGSASRQESYNVEMNVLLQIPGLGYNSSSDSPIGKELLSSLEGGPAAEGANWIGWRLSDMPLLFRTAVEDEWQRTNEVFQRRVKPLDPERTYVLWTKAILPSVVLNRPDGSGWGPEFPLPAF